MRNDPSRTPEAEEIVHRIKAAASGPAGEHLSLLPGLTDAEMDAWECPVPEDVRSVLRESAGLATEDGAGHFGPLHPRNSRPESSEFARCGAVGTFRIVHTSGLPETFYVDVDPESGAWGRVFSFGEDDFASLVAPGFFSWMAEVCFCADRAAADIRDGRYSDFAEAFSAWLSGDFSDAETAHPDGNEDVAARVRRVDNPDAAVLSAEQARRSADRELAEAARGLDDSSFIADLRGCAFPALIPFGEHPDWRPGTDVHSRLRGGEFLAVLPRE